MSKITMLITTGLVAVIAIGGGGYALKRHSDNNKAHEVFMMHEAAVQNKLAGAASTNDSMKHDDPVVQGSYIGYADYIKHTDSYKDSKVVLFFHAPWCPTCRALEKSINANLGSIPAKTIIVKTDYDSSNDLKKKYGITYQHTMVQIDAKGNSVKKWSGSPGLNELLTEIQT